MIVAMMATAAARRAISAARQATDAERALQRRWGNLSIERNLLPATEQILLGREKRSGRSEDSCKYNFPLGQLNFELLLSDEQAKPNANQMLAGRDRASAEKLLRQALAGSVAQTQIVLRPWDTRPEDIQPINALGQVFDGFVPQQLLRGGGANSPGVPITCWGDGKINIYRVNEQSLRRWLGALGISGAEQLTRRRGAKPQPSMAQLLAELRIPPEQAQRLAMLLTSDSRSHSIWIGSIFPGEASRYRLCVQEPAPTGELRVVAFEW
jgi:hypothetical protein